jgi:hypothetical protein
MDQCSYNLTILNTDGKPTHSVGNIWAFLKATHSSPVSVVCISHDKSNLMAQKTEVPNNYRNRFFDLFQGDTICVGF